MYIRCVGGKWFRLCQTARENETFERGVPSYIVEVRVRSIGLDNKVGDGLDRVGWRAETGTFGRGVPSYLVMVQV